MVQRRSEFETHGVVWGFPAGSVPTEHYIPLRDKLEAIVRGSSKWQLAENAVCISTEKEGIQCIATLQGVKVTGPMGPDELDAVQLGLRRLDVAIIYGRKATLIGDRIVT